MKKAGLYVAGAFLAIHGLIEIFSLLLINSGAVGVQKFTFEQLQSNVVLTCVLGVIFGIVRLIAAVGIFRNRKWGLMLGILMSAITFIIMTLYLPMGVADGIFSGVVLVSLVVTYYGKMPAVETPNKQ